MNNPQRNQCEDFIVRHFDGSLTAVEERQLADLLAKSNDARELLSRYMRLEGEMLEIATTGNISDPPEFQYATNANHTPEKTFNSAPIDRRSWLPIAWTALAIAFVATIFGPGVWRNSENHQDHVLRNAVEPVARFSRLVNVNWPGEKDPGVGEAIFPGTIELEQGLVEIEFLNGAIVIVEGPAQLDVASKRHAFLHHGRLRSIVPPEAYGFTIESTDIKVVDLGTEFGFEVAPDGLAEVHVFDGEIEMFEGDDRSTKRLLSAGQAIQIERTGWRREINADQQAFVDLAMLEARAESYVDQLREQSRELTLRHGQLLRDRKKRESELRQDPSLVGLRRAADQARKTAREAAESDPSVANAMKQRKELQIQIDKQIRSNLKKTRKGKQLYRQLDQIEKELTTLRERSKKVRKGRDAKQRPNKQRKVYGENRQLSKLRSELRAKIRKEGAKLRKSDGRIRESIARLNKAKRKADELLRKSNVSKLQRVSESKRKEFLAAQHRMLQNDVELVKLRKQIGETSSRLRSIRRRIHQARKQDPESFLLDGEIVESEIETAGVQPLAGPHTIPQRLAAGFEL